MKDLIIDAFAGGGGASVGIEMALGRPVDIAINHDPDAILMHKTNHPDTLHLTEDIFKVNLKRYVKGQHVALMWASPDCTKPLQSKGWQAKRKRTSDSSVGGIQTRKGDSSRCGVDGKCGRNTTVGSVRRKRLSNTREKKVRIIKNSLQQ